MQGHKIVLTGPMGAGKTTAIRTLSEIAPISTDVDSNDRSESTKDTTTVGFDYGEFRLEDGTLVRLFGTPGQERFDFMWRVLAEGALGVILLLDDRRPDVSADALGFLQAFPEQTRDGHCVVGIGRFGRPVAPDVDRVARHLADHGYRIPVVEVDVRQRDDARLLLSILVAQIEARSVA